MTLSTSPQSAALAQWLEPHIVRAISLVDQGRFPAVSLWEGRAGVGKRLLLRHLVAAIFCEESSRPCLQCADCVSVMNGDEDDVWWLEQEKFKIKDVEELQDFLNFQPARGEGSKKPRVVVVIDFDKFNIQSSNRLLKTLEEPPGNALILLSTSKSVKILPTIRSRVFSWIVKPPSMSQGLPWLREQALGIPDLKTDDATLAQLLTQSGMAPFSALAALGEGDKKAGSLDELETWFRARSLLDIMDSAELVARTFPIPVSELVEGWERRCNEHYKQILGITPKNAMVPFDYIALGKMRSTIRAVKKLACHANVPVNAQLAAEAIGLCKWIAMDKKYGRA
ncbi:MAG: hypothetical protein AB7T49_09670 [Oligoflexales bacterium]